MNDTYTIDLSRVYENLPNQEWSGKTPQSRERDSSTSLHQKSIRDLAYKVWSAVRSNASGAKHQWEDGWTNLNFFISGSRGSGKSTFLRHITKILTNENSSFADSYFRERGVRCPRIHNLFFCDPTAMTSHENFFVSIIGAFKSYIQNNQKIQSEQTHFYLGGGRHHHNEESNGAHTHEFLMSTVGSTSQTLLEGINKLAEGIGLLDEKFAARQERLDAYSQLQFGIKNSNKAHSLKKQFDELVNQIAESYNEEAFLIAIDDADLWCSDNKKIIESIRTYLTHPRLIVFFTADPVLTHETIKEKQFGQFDRHYHQADATNQTRRWDLINDMTAQYLKKVFPSPNHVTLLPLCETAQEEGAPKYCIDFTNNAMLANNSDIRQKLRTTDIFDLLRLAFRGTIAVQESDIDILVSALLRLPLRNIMMTLRFWNDEGFVGMLALNAENKLYLNDEGKRKMPVILAKSFSIACLNELFSYGFSRKDMELNTNFQLCRSLLRHCINCKNLSYGYYLTTSATSFACQESMLMLTAKFKITVSSYEKALAYMLFGPFTVQAYRHYQQNFLIHESKPDIASYDQDKTFLYSQYIQKQFIDYLFFNNSHNPNRWARKISLIFISRQEKSAASIDKGVFLLSHKVDVDALSATLNSLSKSLSGKLSAAGPAQFRAYLLLLILCGQTSHSQNVYYLSVYNLLGFIVQCCHYAMEGKSKTAGAMDKSPLQEYIEKSVERFIMPNIPPTWARNFSDMNSNFNIIRSVPRGGSWTSYSASLARDIESWYETFSAKPCSFFAPDLGRIADIIFQSLCDTSNAISAALNENRSKEKGIQCSLDTIIAILKPLLAPKEESKRDELIAWLMAFPLVKELNDLIATIQKTNSEALEDIRTFTSFSEELRGYEESENDVIAEIMRSIKQARSYFDSDPARRIALRESPRIDLDDELTRTCRSLDNTLRKIDRYVSQLDKAHRSLREKWAKVKSKELIINSSYFNARISQFDSLQAGITTKVQDCKEYAKAELDSFLRTAYAQKEHEYRRELEPLTEQRTHTVKAFDTFIAAASVLTDLDSTKLFCEQLMEFYLACARYDHDEFKLYRKYKPWLVNLEEDPQILSLLESLRKAKDDPMLNFAGYRAPTSLLGKITSSYEPVPPPDSFLDCSLLIIEFITNEICRVSDLISHTKRSKALRKTEKMDALQRLLPTIRKTIDELNKMEEYLSSRRRESSAERRWTDFITFTSRYGLSKHFRDAYSSLYANIREIADYGAV